MIRNILLSTAAAFTLFAGAAQAESFVWRNNLAVIDRHATNIDKVKLGGGQVAHTTYGANAVTVRDVDTFSIQHQLTAPADMPVANFGFAFDISEQYVAVGGSQNINNRVYVYDAANGDFLHAFTNTDQRAFGKNLTLYGDEILVAGYAPQNTVDGTNYQSFATLHDAATGTLLQTYLHPTLSTTLVTEFGAVSAVSQNNVLLGYLQESYDDGAGTSLNYAGAAYLYDKDTGGLLQTFVSPDPIQSGAFGSGVALTDEYAIIGARGNKAVYVYDVDTGDLVQTIASPHNNMFGYSVDAEGDYLLIGAPSANQNIAAYLYDLGEMEFVASTTRRDQSWGYEVSIEDGYATVAGTFIYGSLYEIDGYVPQAAAISSNVPLPAPALLLAGALGAMGLVRRRRG